ncbi:MAG: hypothetical protein PHE99_07950, partial [Bacteroidales bacterium]|nr:hypothetical protein [Bacteroidales bacterium]
LVLRWSLVNNPVSAIKIAWDNVKEQSASVLSGIKTAVAYASDKLFPNSENKDKIIIASSDKKKEVPVDNTLEKSSQLSKMGGVTVADKNILATPSQKPQAQKESDSISREEALDAIKGTLASLIKTASEDDENQVSSQSSLSQLANNKKEEKEVKNSPSVINSGVVTNTRIIASNYQEDESQTDSGVLENKVVENSQTVKTLKISKIYSTLNDDFVEIYNPNNFSVNLLESSYRLEKAKTGLDPSIMIRIGNPADGSYPGGVIIPAHGYYLIVKESASNYYLTRADAIANRKDFSLSGLDQTVYLGIGAISSYQDEDIVDVIGFGPGAKYYLGSSPAPKIEDYHFLNRISYKDNNALDYNLLLSAEPAAIAAWQAENSQELEVPPPPDDPLPPPPDDPLPPPPDDPLPPPPDDPLPPPDDPLPPPPDDPLPPPPDDPLPPPPDDPLPPLSPEEIRIAVAMTKVLINKIGVYGNDDYIELFNYSDIDIDLAENNFRLEKSKATLDPLILVRFGDLEDAIYPGGTIIPAGSSYLVVRDKADARFLALADTIVVREDFNLFASGYSIYLGKGPISSPVDDDTIDLVGYGPESLYYFGSGPAPAILDGHYLERRTSSYNTCNDFVLIRDNYYNLEEGGVDGNEETEEFPFVFPGSQMSPGLKHLWNFDDCYTDLGGQATVGKWACGRKYGFLTGDFSTELDPVLDMSQFSVGFYYKADEYWPRVDLTLDKVGGGKFSLGVEPGYLVVTGAPGSGHFYLETDFKEGQWSYLSLVIDQVEGYWAVFSDGEQLMKKYFLAQLALADTLSLSGGGGYMYFDDLAVWDRPLLKEEIREIIANDLPLYPSQIRSQQLIPQLLYRWNFEEYGQDIAYDSQVNEALSLNSVYWSGRDHDNYAIAVDHLKFAEVDFASPFASQDLSLAFWWKNISHPDEGRVKVDLLEKRVGEELKKFGLTADYYRQYFSFNNHEGMIAEGIDGAIPNDGKWHHLALVYDSYRYRLSFYVDAVKKVDLDLVRMRDGEELVNSLRIYSDARKSAIDELMIFTGSLQQGDIDYIYHTTKTEPWPHEDVWE